MKPTQPLLWNKWMKNGRRPARLPMRFTECKKLELKDSVTSGTKYSSDLACNSQMMEMMSCLKEFDFDQSKCSPQENVARNRLVKNKDEPVPGQTKLTMQQVNSLLQRYPQPRKRPSNDDHEFMPVTKRLNLLSIDNSRESTSDSSSRDEDNEVLTYETTHHHSLYEQGPSTNVERMHELYRGYQPSLNCNQNPIYYEANRVLFEAHRSRIIRWHSISGRSRP
ncbi:hypothetical protein BLOT_011470 [Blomia tropicalis]|nr:hypothetical protein BLOT_011470 [Blomia tropicalis]